MKNVFYQTETAGGGASPQAAAPRFLKMKRLLALLFVLFVGMQGAWAQQGLAYDFAVYVPFETFYFRIIDDQNHYVEVTCPNFFFYEPLSTNEHKPWQGYTKPTGSVDIPERVTYNNITYTVTSIDRFAFANCSDITWVRIPETVTNIGEEAFINNTSLTSVTIMSNAVVSKDYSIWKNLGTIFGNQVTKYVLGIDVEDIGSYAFYDCSNLTSVTINGALTSINSSAFKGCSALTSIDLKDRVRNIYWSAFKDCTALTSIDLGTRVTTIDVGAFSGCSNLTQVSFNSNLLTSIGGDAFSGCSSLTSVTIPNSVTSIGSGAFKWCSSLTSVTIPNSVTSIGSNAFYNCTELTRVNISNLENWCQIFFENDYSNPLFYAQKLYLNDNLVTKLDNNIGTPRAIERHAFCRCTSITSVTIPYSVTSIAQGAFAYCTAITQMTVDKRTPPDIILEGSSSSPFIGIPTDIPLYVPFGAKQRYQIPYWRDFTNIQCFPNQDPANDSPVTIPYTQNFNNTNDIPMPAGWHSFSGTSTVFDQKLRMLDINGSDVVLLPKVSSTLNLWIEMKYKRGVSSNNAKVEIGYVTDIYDESTFVPVCTPQWSTAEWNTVIMKLPMINTSQRYALRNTNSIYIDDVKLFSSNDIPANTEMAYVQDFSVNGSLPEGWLTFKGKAINSSGCMQIIGNELVMLPKLTASAQKRRVMEVDVKIINTRNSTTATAMIGYMEDANDYLYGSFEELGQLECPANATRRKRLYVYTEENQNTRRFAIKTTGNSNATVQVDDVQVYYTYESPEQNDFICNFSTNPINTNSVPHAGAYSYLVGQPNGNLYTNHGATNNWKTGNVNGVSDDEHAYCDISGTEAVSSWLVMPFVKVTADNRLLSYDIAVTHKNGTQQPVNASQVHSSQFLKVYISEDGYNWELKKTYSGSTLANIPPTGVEKGYIRLSEYEDKTIKVAFHAGCNAGVNNNYRVHIDNVTHSNYDVYPPYNVQATNVGLTSATITWQYHLPYQSGGYVYVPRDGITPPTEIGATIPEIYSNSSVLVLQHTNAKQLEVTGLNKGKEYTVWVCSPDVEPLMWESTTFTTASNGAVPTNLSVEVQGRFAVATWDAGAALDWEYVLKRKKPDNTYETFDENGTYGSNRQHFIGLEAGEYSFEVRAEYENTDHSAYYSDYTTVDFTIVDDGSPLYHKPEFTLKDINDVNKLTIAWTSDLPHPKATQYLVVDFCTNEEFYIASEGPSNEHKSFDVSTESIRQFTNEDFIYINEGREFYVRLRVVYSFFGSSSGPINSETLKVTMPVQCAAVTNIAEEVTENAINLTWGGSAVSYEVRYRPEGSSDDYNTVVTENNSVSIDDFMPHTSYEAYIIATCEYGLTSEPVSFMFNNIQFEDTNVKAICLDNWDNNDDGELSYGEAAAVVNLGETFYENGDIVTFNELRYFTGLSDLSGDYFAECPNLTSIVIPASVTSITCSPFRSSSALESITVDAGNTVFASPDNCNAIINTTTNELVAGCKSTVIPYGVEKIGQWAFWGCTSLTSIDIPASVTTIGNKAFNNCSGLTTLTLPASVTHIIDGAFWGCTGLVSMIVEATTPPMITESHDPFSTAVANNIVVYVPCGSLDAYKNEESGWHYLNLIENCIQFEDNNVKAICVDNWDTNGDDELSYAEAAAVTSLAYMFRNNMDITKFDELKYFTGLESLADSDFESCTNLQKITIPKSVSTIGNLVFAHCTSLTQLKVDAENPTFDSRDECNAIIETESNTLVVGLPNTVIPNTVETIRYWAFAHQYSMTTIEIPNSVTAILGGAFYFCTNLQSVTLPSYLESIGGQAFEGCNSLTTLTLSDYLQTIGNQAFAGCFSLTRISVGADTPPVLGRDVFASVDKNIPVYVPCAAVMDYRTDVGWSVFTNIQCNNGDIIVSPGYPYEFGFETDASAWSIGGWDYQCTTTSHSGDRCAYKSGESVSELRTPAIHFDASCDNLVLRFWAKGSGRLFVYYGEDLALRTVISTIANTNEWTLQEFSLSRFMASQTEKTAKFAFSNDYSTGTPKDFYIDDIEVVANAYDKIFDSYQIRRWGYANSWYPSGEPTSSDNVLIASTVQVGGEDGNNPLTAYANTISFAEHSYIQVNKGSVLEATQINYKDSDNVRIKDGGQLKVANDSYAQMYKRFVGYENESSSDHWYLFAPPMTETNSVPSQFTTGNYDLYGFDGTADLEWLNYKNHTQDFQMQNGKGYLYAHERPTGDNDYIEVIMNGWVNKTTEDMTIDGLTHGENTKNNPFYNWNLVGNPFPCNAYLSGNRQFYRLEETAEGSKIVLAVNNVIKPMEGVFVQAATAEENSVTFTTTAPVLGASMDFSLRKANATRGTAATLDRTRVQFGESHGLGHLDLMASANRLYIPQRGKDMAVVGTEPVGELPLHFEAAENGTYTLGFENAAEGLVYCHLIDNLTGADVDLLQQPEYTFEAKTTDYASRFRVVFAKADTANEGDNETFAFIDAAGNIVITNAEAGATLQVIDVMGRVVVSTDVARGVSTNGMTAGVYVLRLINGDDVKVQKIVID